jgi:sugar O-acyltransferase (sialic acid O-acetyltransferase NeuD family)
VLKKIVLIGGGGHCKSCIEVISSLPQYRIYGVLDAALPVGSSIMGYPVLGDDQLIGQLIQEGYEFLITIGKLNTPSPRKRIFDDIKKSGGTLATVIASTAIVSSHAEIGEGTIVMHGAIVNVDSVVGNNCIINTRALLEHDTHVGAHTHISTNTILNGAVHVGADCFIGSSSVVVHGISITDKVIVGANATVTSSIIQPSTYVGSPAKSIKK